MTSLSVHVLTAVLAATLAVAAGAQSRFVVTGMDVPATMDRIGNDGTAVGLWHSDAVAWTSATGIYLIPPTPNGYLAVRDVNNLGCAVGYCDTDLGGGRFSRDPFVWNAANGSSLFLGLEGPGNDAVGINDLGHIAGRLYIGGSAKFTPYLWRGPGEMITFDRLNPTYGASAIAVNDMDWVVGNSGIALGVNPAVVWKPDGSISNIGAPPGQTAVDPTDINDSGNVATVTFGQLGSTVGFLWHPDGTWVQVPNPAWPVGGTYPRGMNDSDAIVGDLAVSQGVLKAFLWTPEAGTRVVDDLLDPSAAGWDVTYLGGINDHGQMCGYGVYQGVGYGIVLDPVLVPVPPSSYTVNIGRRDAGGAGSLATVDGDALRVCRFIVPNLAAAPVDVRIDGTFASGDCLGVTLRVVSRMKNAGAFGQTLELWDWQTGDWDAKDVRTDPVGTGWQTVELVASGDVRRILKADGSLRARYRVRQTGPAATLAWCNEVDQAVWMVAP